MTHPAKDLLYAIGDGKQMEKMHSYDGWVPCTTEEALNRISQGFPSEVRIARPMVERTVRYPEPLRVKPDYCATYWYPTFGASKVSKTAWTDHPVDNAIFNAGMAFATEADAAEAHKALFGVGT